MDGAVGILVDPTDGSSVGLAVEIRLGTLLSIMLGRLDGIVVGDKVGIENPE